MPARLSRLFSTSSKEKEALEDARRNKSSSSTSSPPPSYQKNAPEDVRDNAIRPPDMTAGFSNLRVSNSSADGFPTNQECIAHLKILECFHRLKQSIGSTDGLLGIENRFVIDRSTAQNDETSELLAKLAEKRWAVYVQRAVDRFETWLVAVTPNARMVTRAMLQNSGRKGQLVEPLFMNGTKIRLDRNSMPPADVLMVWHSYMLNPRAYLEDCLRYGRMPLWHTRMPYAAAAECINSKTFTYEPSPQAVTSWESLTGRPWDNTADADTKSIACSACDTKLLVPWTTCNKYRGTVDASMGRDQLKVDVDQMLSSGRGYCDKDFVSAACPACHEYVTHDKLRVAKFTRHIKNLLNSDVPMSGTILGLQGLPWMAFGEKDTDTEAVNKAPNELLQQGLGKKILQSTCGSIDDIRTLIDSAMKDKPYMRKARGSYSSTMLRAERIAVRKMMSHYWENSSHFALDLLGAVIRQGTFIEKMHNIDWLHSPALPSTMQRLRQKYHYFMRILAEHPDRMAVPTLDVDLAWHTHQLSPYKYMQYTVTLTRQFIDHDDKVAETKLNDSFAWTSKIFQKKTGQPYSECTCWYCEAVRESNTSSASRLFGGNNAAANEKLFHRVEQDPAKSVHISAHNAVRPTDDSVYDLESKKKAEQLELAYQKACERAKRKGRPAPKRDDYYYSDAWGYPVYIPAYSPYVGFVPYAPMYYPVTPGCMAVGSGNVGNCCAGTCGGAVAAGGCSSSGGCASGNAGGCGSSGGGCGGGGGGGGGGCGGGGGGGGGGC